MELTAAAAWLNNTFSGFDGAILGFMHTLADKAGGFLTPLMKFITLLGEKGIIFLALAIVFMCFSKTRKMGVCLFGAVCCGALITNVILKDMIARPRPFESMTTYTMYWNFIGSPAEDGFSFPSGHVTAAAAGMMALCLTKGKKMAPWSVVVVLLMCVSRNYLMAHFPSDVLFAAVIGIIAALIAFIITKLIFTYMEDNDDLPLWGAILNFNVPIKVPEGAQVKDFALSAADKVKVFVVNLINGKGKKSKSGHAAPQTRGNQARARTAAPERRVPTRPAPTRQAREDDSTGWNDRWEKYNAAKSENTRTDIPAPKFDLDDEDADMKIVGARPGAKSAPKSAEDDFDIDSIINNAAAQVKSEPASFDLDAILESENVKNPMKSDDEFPADTVSPRREREYTRPQGAPRGKGSAYKGKHER